MAGAGHGVQTPYRLVADAETARGSDKRRLVALTRELEHAALVDPPAVVAATLQDERYLTPPTRQVYAALAATGCRATLLARGLQSWIADGVTGISLDDDDPLVDEWVVVLPSPRTPVVFAAVDLKRSGGDDLGRSFSYALSHDPAVVRACLALLVPHVDV